MHLVMTDDIMVAAGRNRPSGASYTNESPKSMVVAVAADADEVRQFRSQSTPGGYEMVAVHSDEVQQQQQQEQQQQQQSSARELAEVSPEDRNNARMEERLPSPLVSSSTRVAFTE